MIADMTDMLGAIVSMPQSETGLGQPLSRMNLIASWAGILLGFVSGMLLGAGFQKEDFLGGYGSRQRRLYRLGHISFFGLGLVNFMFWMTVSVVGLEGGFLPSASIALLVGATTMPICCVLMAHTTKAHALFAVPVLALLYGATCTLLSIVYTR